MPLELSSSRIGFVEVRKHSGDNTCAARASDNSRTRTCPYVTHAGAGRRGRPVARTASTGAAQIIRYRKRSICQIAAHLSTTDGPSAVELPVSRDAARAWRRAALAAALFASRESESTLGFIICRQ